MLLLLEQQRATQKQLQLVGGGLVYLCMFRRNLLGALNCIWSNVTALDGKPPGAKFEIPAKLRMELLRFLALTPLACMDFRRGLSLAVTASDASTTGGGATVSQGLTPYGQMAANAWARGDIPEKHEFTEVLTIGLFDELGALRVAADLIGLPMAGHVSCHTSIAGRRVVESHFPGTIFIEDVALIDEAVVRSWAARFSSVGLVLLGAGLPCQGAPGLTSDRKGALQNLRSKLFHHVPRVQGLLKLAFPWAQVHTLMESVASTDWKDRHTISEVLGVQAWRLDAAGISICRRSRLYWCTWELLGEVGAQLQPPEDELWSTAGLVEVPSAVDSRDVLEPGWRLVGDKLPTFTTSRPRSHPGHKPAVVEHCSPKSSRCGGKTSTASLLTNTNESTS